MLKRIRKRRLQNGAATVELAILLGTILLPLLFGIIEFSFILYDKAMITNASREGARAGIVFSDPRLTAGEISAVVDNYCQDNLISFGGSSPTTTVTGADGDHGDPLTVTVTYDYDFLVLPEFVESITGPITLTAQTIMRME